MLKTIDLTEAEMDAIYTALLFYNPDDDPDGGKVVDRIALMRMEDVFELATGATVSFEE